MVYSGKNKNERATAVVGMLSRKCFQYNIDDIDYMNESLLKITDKHVRYISWC